MFARDGASTSLWQDSIDAFIPSTTASPDTVYDVIIIGGGITGLATGYALQKQGKKCLLIEARNIGFGTTGGTTAHLNTLLDTTYPELISNFGEDNAKLVADAARRAIAMVKSNIDELDIDCDFEPKAAFIFAQNEDQAKELDELHEGCEKVGVRTSFVQRIPVPIPFSKALRIDDQAQFNPMKYVVSLAKAFEAAGGAILEQTRVTGVEENDIAVVTTEGRNYQARFIVFATHIPIGINLLHLRCAPYRSYAMAVKLKDASGYPAELAYDSLDPYHYYRTHVVNGEPYLIAGGYDHRTAAEDNTEKCFLQLEAHIRTYFDVDEISYAWSSQYFEPTDGLPYIGRLPGHEANILVATGFSGNGMIHSHIAARVLAHIIQGQDDPCIKLFDPNRIKPVAGFMNFISHNATVAGEMLGKLVPAEKLEEVAALAPGESRIVKKDGVTMALHKDPAGRLHAVYPECTHMKCTIAWNSVESSWDCPCHGARFDIDGAVLTGPASVNLKKLPLQ